MKKMPRFIAAGLAIVALAAVTALVMVAHPATSFAVDPFKGACSSTGGSAPSDSTVCKTNQGATNPLTGQGGALTNVVDILSIVGGIVVVIIIIVGGIKYITSSGDSAQAAKAKNTVIYGLVGLLVIGLARTIISFVLGRVN